MNETEKLDDQNNNFIFQLNKEEAEIRIADYRELISILTGAIRSEDPKDYGLNEAENLDIFAWEMVADSKSSNVNILHAIEKLKVKIAKLSLKFNL
jgi:hypothetical protein